MTQTTDKRLLAQALLQQGVDASHLNRDEEAFGLYVKSAEADPSWGIPLFLIGSHHAAHGNPAEAENAFSNAALLSPDFPMARYQLGTLQFSSGRAASALVTWQPLLDLPDDSPLPHFIRGYGALAQDDFEDAVSHYEEGLKKNEGNVALSGDIRKILAAISGLRTAAHAPDSPSASDGLEMKHILLSNYQR